MTKYTVLGAGPAAVSAIEAIRKVDHEGSISLIAKEKHMPYSPMVLPYLIEGVIDSQKLGLRDGEFFRDLRVTLTLGRKAVAVDTGKRIVTTDAGGPVEFDKLLIATGARPLVPKIPGADFAEVCSLRIVEDALKIAKLSETKRSVIVIGAGLVSMHAAEVLRKKGLRVTVVEMLPQVLPQNFDSIAASIVQAVFESKGIEICTGVTVREISRSGEQLSVHLGNGRQIDGGFVLMGTGVSPRTELVQGTEIKCRNGILVDERMRTNVRDIYAAGDIAEAKDFWGDNMLSPIEPSAQKQGMIAGFNMAGKAVKYAGSVDVNAFKFFGNRAYTIGKLKGAQDVVYRHKEKYRRLVFDGDRMIGGIFVNDEVEPGIVLHLIRTSSGIQNLRGEMATPGVNCETWYKRLFLDGRAIS